MKKPTTSKLDQLILEKASAQANAEAAQLRSAILSFIKEHPTSMDLTQDRPVINEAYNRLDPRSFYCDEAESPRAKAVKGYCEAHTSFDIRWREARVETLVDSMTRDLLKKVEILQ
jgi:hypothetical protein